MKKIYQLKENEVSCYSVWIGQFFLGKIEFLELSGWRPIISSNQHCMTRIRCHQWFDNKKELLEEIRKCVPLECRDFVVMMEDGQQPDIN